MKIIITEKISDHRRLVTEFPRNSQSFKSVQVRPQLIGSVHYTYESPTHWGSHGCCEVVVKYSVGTEPSVRLDWSSGGTNEGFTDAQIADAMSKAFAMASNRINQIESELEKENETA